MTTTTAKTLTTTASGGGLPAHHLGGGIGVGGGSTRHHFSRHKLTKQAPVQLNVTPPPPNRVDDFLNDDDSSSSLRCMLSHHVSDRRIMYAKSKFSFKRLPMSRPSQEASSAIESLDGGGGGGGGGGSTEGSSRPTSQLGRYLSDKSNQKAPSHDHPDNEQCTPACPVHSATGTTTAATGSSLAPSSTTLLLNTNHIPNHYVINKQHSVRLESSNRDLLDPTQIPAQVRNSLLDMHYHLHQKPPLLQTSRISKSDSNIKSGTPNNLILHQSKKLLSLQKSSCD